MLDRSWSRGRHAAAIVGSAVIETLYPRRCAGCRRRGTWVCEDCDRSLTRFTPPWCPRCGVPTTAGCRCGGLDPALEAVRSLAPFDGWLHGAVIAFKYQDERARADHLGRLLTDVVRQMAPVDALVPVPLHAGRQRRRGYNQSALVARRAGDALGVPVLDALRRLRATPRQVGLGADGRRDNVAGAFGVVSDIDLSGLCLVVVDDVVTTGSTLGACAAALRDGGAAVVRAATLAREL